MKQHVVRSPGTSPPPRLHQSHDIVRAVKCQDQLTLSEVKAFGPHGGGEEHVEVALTETTTDPLLRLSGVHP